MTQNIQSHSGYNRIQLYVNVGLTKCGVQVMASWRLNKMLQHKILHIWMEITWLTGKFQVIRITLYLFCICCCKSLMLLTSVLSTVKFRYLSRARNLRVLNQGEWAGHAVGPHHLIHCSGNMLKILKLQEGYVVELYYIW